LTLNLEPLITTVFLQDEKEPYVSSEPCHTGFVLKGVEHTACTREEEQKQLRKESKADMDSAILHGPRMIKEGGKNGSIDKQRGTRRK
jgi:hypothetical protein